MRSGPRLGYGDDERMRDAAYLVMSKRRLDGKWVLEGDWFSEPRPTTRWLEKKEAGDSYGTTDPWGNPMKGWTKLDLEQVEPSKWVTLNPYRAVTRTGDLKVFTYDV